MNPFDWESFRPISDIKPPASGSKIRNQNLKKSPLLKKKNPFSKDNFLNTKPKIEAELPDGQNPKKFTRNLTFAVVAFLLIGSIMLFSSLHGYRQEVVRSLSENIENLREETQNFSLLKNLQGETKNPPLTPPKGGSAQEFAANFWPLLKESLNTYKDFQGLSNDANTLFSQVSSLAESFPNLIFKQKGGEIIGQLEAVNVSLKSIIEKNSILATHVSNLKDFSNSGFDFYLPFQTDLSRYQTFLESFIAWLKSEENHHLLVLFLNPSEIRPGGGFLGSYADVTLNQGNVLGIEVRDINDIDRGLKLKIVPPKPVQVIASKWKTADANWFFDFPSSARAILQFAENSELYAKADTSFDGVIAVSAEVVGDLLGIVGPVELDEEKITLTQEDFLYEIQKEVQTGRAEGESYPKKILQDATPFILEKVSNLDSSQKSQLFALLNEWFSKKDLMVYFKNPEFQKLFNQLNISGEVYSLPGGFMGDYLAVVNANLGGGKTDIFIEQEVELQSQVNEDGTISNKLKISRDHTGDEAKSWWYRVVNQNYLSIFTPKDTRLDDFTGGVAKSIKAPLNYQTAGYVNDPLIAEIEASEKDFLVFPNLKTYQAFGKNIFAVWTKTEIGKKSETYLSYVSRLSNPLQLGETYQFIFEKQPGASGSYKFDISAPIGFVWKENNLPIYEYISKDPPGRLIIPLTLKKPD